MSAQTPNSKRFPKNEGKSLLDESLDFGPEETVLPPSDIKRLEEVLKQIDQISARIDKISGDR